MLPDLLITAGIGLSLMAFMKDLKICHHRKNHQQSKTYNQNLLTELVHFSPPIVLFYQKLFTLLSDDMYLNNKGGWKLIPTPSSYFFCQRNKFSYLFALICRQNLGLVAQEKEQYRGITQPKPDYPCLDKKFPILMTKDRSHQLPAIYC